MCLSLMSLGLHGNVKVAHIVCVWLGGRDDCQVGS